MRGILFFGICILLFCNNFALGSLSSFFHISDFHYDASYSAIYNFTTLCREHRHPSLLYKDEHLMKELSRADLRYDGSSGYYGRFGCDSPYTLIKSSLEAMRNVDPNPSFILFSGDMSAHDVNDAGGLDDIRNVSATIDLFFPTTPVIVTLGNNDVYPDYADTCGPHNARTLELATIWRKWIPSDQMNNFLSMGSFHMSPAKGIRVISFNSVMYSTKSAFNSSTLDPCGQFEWLMGVLRMSENLGESVHIVSHIPPIVDNWDGKFLWNPIYIDRFTKILINYSQVVKSLYFGHTHKDEFRLIKGLKDNQPVVLPAFIAPAISPIYANNPSFRRLFFDSDSLTLLDYDTYYLDLLQSNYNGIAQWRLEYNFQKAYGQKSLDGNSISSLLSALQSDPRLFLEWYSRFAVSYMTDKLSVLCSLGSNTIEQYNNCLSQASVAKKSVQ